MKICIVSLNIVPFYQGNRERVFGGAEVQTAFLAHTFRECGHEVVMVVSDLDGAEGFPYPAENAFFTPDGIPGLRFFHPRWTGITAALERADADIYYQRNAGMITGLVAMFCRRRGRTFVYGAGSNVDFSPREAPVHNWRDRTLHSYGLRRSHGIVVQNAEQEAAARERLRQPIRVIPNGVLPSDTAAANPDGYVLWVGAMREIKRPLIALDVARQLPGRRFLIVGGPVSTEPNLPGEIRREAASIPNVTIEGRLSRDEVQERISGASMLINTSHSEGFPNAYLEAWNHGVPVVTMNDVDGIVRERGVGIVCQTPAEMVAAVASFDGAPERLRDMGERARELVRERFSPAVIGQQYTEFFEMLRQTGTEGGSS